MVTDSGLLISMEVGGGVGLRGSRIVGGSWVVGSAFTVQRWRQAASGKRKAESGVRIAESGQRNAECGKRIAESGKRIAESGQRIAESGKRRAASGERQAESGKRRAASGERQADDFGSKGPKSSATSSSSTCSPSTARGKSPLASIEPKAASRCRPASTIRKGIACFGLLPRRLFARSRADLPAAGRPVCVRRTGRR